MRWAVVLLFLLAVWSWWRIAEIQNELDQLRKARRQVRELLAEKDRRNTLD